jgi:hypothetical protein
MKNKMLFCELALAISVHVEKDNPHDNKNSFSVNAFCCVNYINFFIKNFIFYIIVYKTKNSNTTTLYLIVRNSVVKRRL